MTRWLALIVAVAFVFPALSSSTAHAVDDAQGKKLFLGKKCNACHTIEAKGIERISADEEEDDVPDLSKVGKKHDAGWISRFLDRKEKLNGKTHKKKLKATDEERNALAEWLASLK